MTGRSGSPNLLLIAGLYRSGTTLAEKLLHAHPNVIVGPQPFPPLYHVTKAAFHREIGVRRRYPLDHLFLEDAYGREQWQAFLQRYRLSAEDLNEAFRMLAEVRGTSGTPEVLHCRDRIVPGPFDEVHRRLTDCIASIFPKPAARYIGTKEIVCEEYVPHVLERGIKVVLVVRDPRGVLASVSCGRHGEFSGALRPTLYTLRCWRKSMAFALAYEGHPDFRWIRYEDLVASPQGVLAGLCAFLSIEPFDEDAFSGGIADQWGRPWRGNSSFGEFSGISQSPVNAFASRLPAPTVAFAESCCLPEMSAAGYRPTRAARFDPDALRGFREPFPIRHARFDPGYSHEPGRIASEIRRFELLEQTEPLPARESRRWFLHERTYDRLRNEIDARRGRPAVPRAA